MTAPKASRTGAQGDDARGFEPWSLFAFGWIGLAALGLVYLGSRPGGGGPIWVFTTGFRVLGLVAAAALALALVWCVLRKPVLQRGRLPALLSLAGVLWLTSFPLAFPSSHEGHPSRVTFRLPFDGEWKVGHGGNEREQNLLIHHPARRFGWLFDPPSPGAPVVSPASGEIEFAGPTGWVLRVAEGEYLVLEGVELDPGSVVGERVNAGDPVGRAGEHGVILFLQDGAIPATGEGIPLRFSAVRVDGRDFSDSIPVRGQRVRPVDPAPMEKASR